MAIDAKLGRVETGLIPDNQVSLSDNGAYPLFCHQAAFTPAVFHRFRQHPVYRVILEHVTIEHGRQYLGEIRKSHNIYASLDSLRQNDLVGGPKLSDIDELKQINTTTLRYVKVLCDLENMFGSLRGTSICEIGVGYGGQCRVIDDYFQPRRYCLVDLRPALNLAEAWLSRFPLQCTISFRTMNELEYTESDLVISNYAFTELPRWIQERYMEKIISRSKRGYITFNRMNPAHFSSFTVEELLARIPGSAVLPESPCTYEGNCLIAWGHLCD
jgi:hypothetical protein